MHTPSINSLISALFVTTMLSACSGTSETDTNLTTPTPTTPAPTPTTPTPSTGHNTQAPSSSTQNSITAGQQWAYFKGIQNPNINWKLASFDDSNWATGNSGFGYQDGDDNTVLSDMAGNYTAVYTRKTFTHSSATAINSMTLSVDYDDGFIAYLNGVEIARSESMPAGIVNYNTTANTTREAGVAALYNINASIDDLVEGTNVIAIEVHNQSLNSSDLSLITSLYFNENEPPVGGGSGGGSGGENGGGSGGGGSTPGTTSGSLSNYTNVGSLNTLSFIGNDLSGITYVSESGTYFLIQNNGGRIWEVDASFNLIRTITINGFGDSEDIVSMGNNEFAIVNENSQLFIVNIFSNTTSLNTNDTANVQTITFGSYRGNYGAEGVAFDKATQTFYIVKEAFSKAIYSFPRPGPGNQTITPNIPFSAEDVLTMAEDLSAIVFDPRTDTLLILSDVSDVVIDVDISGNILGVLQLADEPQPEGITLDNNYNLQITSEANFQRTYAIAP